MRRSTVSTRSGQRNRSIRYYSLVTFPDQEHISSLLKPTHEKLSQIPASAIPGEQVGSQREKKAGHDQQDGYFREHIHQTGTVVHDLADAFKEMS